jgi:hypothetical protein
VIDDQKQLLTEIRDLLRASLAARRQEVRGMLAICGALAALGILMLAYAVLHAASL